MNQQLEQASKIADSHVFDLAMSWRGYRINKLCNSLSEAANRAAYKLDEEACLTKFGLSEAEKALVRARDFSGLLEAGGNIYFLLKLGVVTGNGLYHMGAKMRGESYEQFLATRNNNGAV
jgi:protocatechuate 4,5-dioxygenase alpha subunit